MRRYSASPSVWKLQMWGEGLGLLPLWSASRGSVRAAALSRQRLCEWKSQHRGRGCDDLIVFTVWHLFWPFTHQIKQKCPTVQSTKQRYRTKLVVSMATYMRKKIPHPYTEKCLSSCLSDRLFVTFLTLECNTRMYYLFSQLVEY